jgi:uncharacterized protein (DUF58 family)
LATATPLLFDSTFLAKLEQLYLLSKKLFRGEHHAERKSRQTGSSLEFADYRNYSLGDDLRSIDWNIYGRLDRLFVKLFEQEQDLHIYFLIDASASMRWQPPSLSTLNSQLSTKLDQARRIAASLAYIGLANLDRVNVLWFADLLLGDMGLSRGKSQFHKVLDFLERPPSVAGSSTGLLPSLRAFAQRVKRRGLVFVISDFFDPAGYEDALGLLRYNNFDLHVIHTLDPAELRPRETGDLRLVEAETGEVFEVTANDALLRRYEREIDGFIAGLENYCQRRGIGYVRATTEIAFEDLVLRVLRDGTILK